MRVGILTQYYPPEIGAPQARLSFLARRLRERGHRVYVLTAMPSYPAGRVYDGYGGMLRREAPDGSSVIRTWAYATNKTQLLPRLGSYLSFACSSALAGAALWPRLDYLLTESPPLPLGLTGYLLSRMKNARWVFNVSDLWPDSAVRLGALRNGWARKAAYALERFCYRKAWVVTGQSAEILESIQQRFPWVRTLPFLNGVDPGPFLRAERDLALRRRLGCEDGVLVIYAGLHGIAQGLEQVLYAAAELRDLPDLHFALVGDGVEKRNLLWLSQELGLRNVHFHDPVPHAKIPDVLASADIAFVPLKRRLPGAVPSKLYEAMAAGLPVVVVAEGEAADIVKKEAAGVAVSPGDRAGLAAALRCLYEDAGLRKQCGESGRRGALEKFDRRVIVDRLIDFWEDSLAC